jgi:enediyne biosynthesis protein E4
VSLYPRAAAVALAALALLAAGSALRAQEEDPCRGLRFVDVATAAGLDFRHATGAAGEKHLPETMGAGVAWLDYDGDGRLDLYVVQSGPFPPDGSPAAANRLFRNLGDGTFEDVTATSGSGDRGYGQGVLAFDYDGDGWSDLYLANFGADRLLRNLGDGRFADVSDEVGLAVAGWSSSAAAADADGDGRLDLYVTRYVEYDAAAPLFCGDPQGGERRYCDPTLFRGEADVLLRNEAGPVGARFVDATAAAGLAGATGRGLGVVFADLDEDGRADLYVANDLDWNFLFRNLGGGSFEDISLLSGAAVNREGKPEAGMGVVAADLLGDGRAHLAVTNFDVETNTLYRNLGDMVFEDVATESGFGLPSFNLLGFGIVAADFDRDGRLDVYVANGHIFERPFRDNVAYEQPDLLLLGRAGGRFAPAACGPAFDLRFVGRGLAAGDLDDDGALELAVANSAGPLQLLRVEGAPGGWLGARLVGGGANREAIGARLELVAGGARQLRWVLSGDSYQSSSERRALFGLANSAPEALEVRWPSGRRQRLLSPPAGRYLTLFEPETR